MEVAGLVINAIDDTVTKARANLKGFVAVSQEATRATNALSGASAAANAQANAMAVSATNEAAALGKATGALKANSAAHLANAQSAKAMANNNRMLMFQINDIATSLASGMNPAMVAAQQGGQILQLGVMNVVRSLGSLAAAFGPVLAVLGVVMGVFAAFTTEINRGQKQQVSFFDVVIAGWELVTESIGRAFEPIAKWLAWLWDQAAPIISDLGILAIKTFDLAFRNIGTIFGSLPALLGDLTISTAQAVIDGVQDMLNGAIKLLNDFTAGSRDLLKAMGIEAGPISDVVFGRLSNPWAGAMGDLPGKMAQNLADVNGTNYLGVWGDRSREVANRPSKDAAEKAAKEAERQAAAYADLIRSSQQFIAGKNLEAQSLGMTAEAAARLRYQQEMLNKAANDNIALSPAQRSQIDQLAGAMAAVEERTRQLTQAYDFGKSTLGSFFSDLKSELMSGTSLWGSFATAGANALQTIADKALSMAADGIWDMIFGAAKGALFGGGFGTYGASTPYIPGGFVPGVTGPRLFSTGGWTGVGSGVVGGVHEQEFVVRKGPAAKYRPMLEAMNENRPVAANGNSVTVNAPITINGNADAMTLRQMETWARNTLPGLVRQAVNDPYAVGA